MAIIGAILAFCLHMPDGAKQFVLNIYLGLGAMIWKFVKWFLPAIRDYYPILGVVFLGYLWNACSVNSLKSKGITGRLYKKLLRSFYVYTRVLVYSAFVFVVAMSCAIGKKETVVSLEEFGNLFLCFAPCAVGFILVFCVTFVKNEDS